jgi:hypothetical protein
MPKATIAKRFQTERFNLLSDERVRVSDYQFGHNSRGERDVWIERSEKGERFLSQISYEGDAYAVRKEIYTRRCYILREKPAGHFFFLDQNDCGFWLHNESFSGAETFFGDESVKITNWLTGQNGSKVTLL